MYSKFSKSRICYFHINNNIVIVYATNFSGQAIKPSSDFVTSQDPDIQEILIGFYYALDTILRTEGMYTHTHTHTHSPCS